MAHTPVLGYKEQLPEKLDLVNFNKIEEEKILRRLELLREDKNLYDQRAISIAFTSFQEAFMWFNRAILQPERIKLPEEPSEVPTKKQE